MSITRAIDIAYVRMAAPDVELQSQFLLDFGLVDLGENGGARMFRTEAGGPFCYALSQGEPAFLGFGFWVPNEAALAALAAHDHAEVRPLDAPGGGRYVRLTDPDGFTVDAVAGQAPAPAPVGEPGEAADWNDSGSIRRIDRFRRVGQGPSRVLRLGHLGMAVSNFAASEKWYKDRFGLLTSDEFQAEPGKSVGSFMRTDRGSHPSDHHTLVLFEAGTEPRLRHIAFEVGNVDDLMAGREHLIHRGYKPHWGIGRHMLGSQIFDYWFDPYGREHEHWTDGDQLSADMPPKTVGMDEVMGVQWGMERPTRT